MQQDGPREIRGLRYGRADPLEQHGAANRGDVDVGEQRRPAVRPPAGAEGNADVGVGELAPRWFSTRRMWHSMVRWILAEGVQVLGEPGAGKHRRTGDGEPSPDLIRFGEADRRRQNILQGGGNGLGEDPARVGQDHTAADLAKELVAERVLQPAQLVADGAVGEIELRRGLGEALMAGCGFEGLQGRQGQVAQVGHGLLADHRSEARRSVLQGNLTESGANP